MSCAVGHVDKIASFNRFPQPSRQTRWTEKSNKEKMTEARMGKIRTSKPAETLKNTTTSPAQMKEIA